MIIGIGTDIIEIERIEKAIKNNSNFLNRILTEQEINSLKNNGLKVESIAGRFAAKEAISKALGTGFRKFSFTDIEILNNELGKPEVLFSTRMYEQINMENKKVQLSISHNKTSAIAFAIIEE